MIRKIRTETTQLAMVVYPAVAYPAGRYWRVLVRGTVWRTPALINRRQRMMIRMLGNVMRATPDQLQSEPFLTRIGPFMAEPCHRLPVAVRVEGQEFPLRKRTRRNGHFEETLLLPADLMEEALSKTVDRRLPFEVVSPQLQELQSSGELVMHHREGLSVISDIDDTIKDSQVVDRRELLANTFLRTFRGVPGMADLYQQWADQGTAFHYVSSSPWQLYPALQALTTHLGFPSGTMHLRNFRLRDQLLKRLIIRRSGKATEIRKLLLAMPQRKFLLVGDSGEKDPRIYQKICREFPGRIEGVFIRNMPHRRLDAESRNGLEHALPDGLCATFDDARELEQLVQPLLGELVASAS